jgi:hypothetical protein
MKRDSPEDEPIDYVVELEVVVKREIFQIRDVRYKDRHRGRHYGDPLERVRDRSLRDEILARVYTALQSHLNQAADIQAA